MGEDKQEAGDELKRSLAQFFFEIGYGACWAEAFARNEVPPFALTDAHIEGAWPRSIEAYEDSAEIDSRLALAGAAPALYKAAADALVALEGIERVINAHGMMLGNPCPAVPLLRAALALARGEALASTDREQEA